MWMLVFCDFPGALGWSTVWHCGISLEVYAAKRVEMI